MNEYLDIHRGIKENDPSTWPLWVYKGATQLFANWINTNSKEEVDGQLGCMDLFCLEEHRAFLMGLEVDTIIMLENHYFTTAATVFGEDGVTHYLITYDFQNVIVSRPLK